KDGLCKINGNGSSMHVGLLSFEDLIPTPMKTSALLSRKQTGESIPSVEALPKLYPPGNLEENPVSGTR
ncbi:MAG: hypothetical protein ACK5RC_14480, partial [Curvibacter sp.]